MADEDQGSSFLRRFYPWIKNWEGRLTNLLEIFRNEEIDWLLQESLIDEPNQQGIQFVTAVTQTDYKDEPKVDKDGKPSSSRTTALHHAARLSPSDANILVPGLFKIYDRFDVNYTDVESGLTHFHIACEFGCEEVVQRFLELGQDPNLVAANASIDPPLHTALKSANAKVIELLLKHKTDPNLTNGDGSTALHVICEKHCDAVSLTKIFFEICERRYLQPVQVDAKNGSGQTPLHLAIIYDKKKVAEILLRKGADPNSTDWEGTTPLHIICAKQVDDYFLERFFKICAYVKKTVNINAQDANGDPPLFLAVEGGHIWMAKLLLDKDVDPNLVNEKGSTALHIVCKNFEYMFLTWSIYDKLSAQIDAQDKLGNTPLHLALLNRSRNTAEFLLMRYGANPTLANRDGSTALHLMCERNDEFLYVLLRMNPRHQKWLLAQDEFRGTPLDVALRLRILIAEGRIFRAASRL